MIDLVVVDPESALDLEQLSDRALDLETAAAQVDSSISQVHGMAETTELPEDGVVVLSREDGLAEESAPAQPVDMFAPREEFSGMEDIVVLDPYATEVHDPVTLDLPTSVEGPGAEAGALPDLSALPNMSEWESSEPVGDGLLDDTLIRVVTDNLAVGDDLVVRDESVLGAEAVLTSGLPDGDEVQTQAPADASDLPPLLPDLNLAAPEPVQVVSEPVQVDAQPVQVDADLPPFADVVVSSQVAQEAPEVAQPEEPPVDELPYQGMKPPIEAASMASEILAAAAEYAHDEPEPQPEPPVKFQVETPAANIVSEDLTIISVKRKKFKLR